MHVRLSDFSLRLRTPLSTGRGLVQERRGVLVQIRHGDAVGWGEALPLEGWPGADLAATRAALSTWAARPELAHPDPAYPELAHPDPAWLPSERFARAAVDVALLHLHANQQDTTPADLLARAAGDTAPAGRVALHALVEGPQQATAAVAAGYAAVKLKVGAATPAADVVRVQQVRAVLGEGPRLRLDANGAWNPQEALDVLQRLASCDVEYVEEPTAGVDNLAWLAERSPVAVAIDESLAQRPDPLTAPVPVRTIIAKPMALGGPSATLAAARRWIAAGHHVVVGSYLDSLIGQHAALSVAASLSHLDLVHGAVTPALFQPPPAGQPHGLAADLPVVAGHVALSDAFAALNSAGSG